jgi:hypothetical protein
MIVTVVLTVKANILKIVPAVLTIRKKTLIIGAKILINDRDGCSDNQGKYPSK